MPRAARMVIVGEAAAYHIISRTALDNYPVGDIEKDELAKIIKPEKVIPTKVKGLGVVVRNVDG